MAGRPSKYNDEIPVIARKLALLGLVDEQIMEFLGVSNGTFYAWKKKHPDFAAAIDEGKTIPDAEVAHALYNRALTGDTTACIFWLKNRQPEHWRDVKHIDKAPTDERDYVQLSDAELEEEVRRERQRRINAKEKGEKQLH